MASKTREALPVYMLLFKWLGSSLNFGHHCFSIGLQWFSEVPLPGLGPKPAFKMTSKEVPKEILEAFMTLKMPIQIDAGFELQF